MVVFWITWPDYDPEYVNSLAKQFERMFFFLTPDEQIAVQQSAYSLHGFELGLSPFLVTPSELWAKNAIDPATLAWLSRN